MTIQLSAQNHQKLLKASDTSNQIFIKNPFRSVDENIRKLIFGGAIDKLCHKLEWRRENLSFLDVLCEF